MDTLIPEGGERRDEIEAILALDGVPGVGPARLRTLIERYGSARAALRSGVAGRGASLAAARAGARSAAECAEALGMDVLLYGDPSYPSRLRHLADPPSLLFLRGRAELLDPPGVAIVGARRATARGRSVARKLGAAVAGAGIPVVSGLALGVDGEAHRGALDADGPTVAVLGRGADEAYPPSHRRLFRDVLRAGLIVSEFAPGVPAFRYNFPRRNRILAALAQAVVVVEAGMKSGALITVEHALDLGLDVYAVPGPIDSPSCRGSNGLLVDGARPLISVSAFVREALGVEEETTPVTAASAEEHRILTALEAGSASVDDLVRTTELDAARALALLTRLEQAGRVERIPGMRFRRAG